MNRMVVVIGGGYGGSAVAKALDSEADVILIDPRDAFVNSAGSLRALVQPDGSTVVPAAVVSEYKGRDLFTGRFAELFGTAGKE